MTGATRIYSASVPEGYEWALPVDGAHYQTLRGMSERDAGVPWEPIVMYLLRSTGDGRVLRRRSKRKRADLPWLGEYALILRDEAIEAVGSVLAPHGVLLPLSCADARLVAFTAAPVAGVLDEEGSDIVRYSSGRIMMLRRPAFRLEGLQGRQAFTLAEMPGGALFLTGELVEAIMATGLTAGTEFTLVHEGAGGS